MEIEQTQVVEPVAAPPTEVAVTPPSNDRLNLEPPPPPQDTPPDKQFAIPESYKDKGWAKNIKSEDDVWKMLDNTQSLVGKKTVVPDFEKATPKEIDDYYAQMRPADKSAYDLAPIPDTERETYAELLHKHGISAKQGSDLIKEYAALQQEQLQKAYDKDAFFAELKESFGPSFEETTKKLSQSLALNLNEQDKNILNSMPNQYVALVYRLANNITNAYGVNELGIGASAPSSIAPVNIEAEATKLREQIRTIKTRPHTAAELSQLIGKLTNLYKTGS